MPQVESPSARRGWRRRALRIGLLLFAWTTTALVGLVVLAIGAVFVGIRTPPGERLAVRIGLHFAAKYLAARITVGALRTNLYSGIELENVTMTDIEGQECAHLDRLTVRFSVWPLLHNGLRIDSAIVEGGRGRVRSLSDGRINFAALLKPSQPLPPAPDQAASKFRVAIANVRAQIEGRYEPAAGIQLAPVTGLIDVVGAVGVGGGDVTVDVRALSVALRGPAPAVAAARGTLVVHEGNVVFSPTHADVTLLGSALHAFARQPELRGKYHLAVDAIGGLDRLAITAQLVTPSQPVHIAGELRVGERFGWKARVYAVGLDPEKIGVGAPAASITLDVNGHGDSAATHVAVASSRIVAARNELRMRGSVEIGKTLAADLALDLDARDLSTLHGRGLPRLAGAIDGHARVRYAPASLRLDAELGGRGLEVPALRVGTVRVVAHTENVRGQVLVEANGVHTAGLSLAYTRVQANGDRRSFFVRASTTGADGTSLDLALHGTPRYAGGALPVGVIARFDVLDLDRRGERWHLGPTATLVYGDVLTLRGLRLSSQRQSLSVDGTLDLATRRLSAKVEGRNLDAHGLAALWTSPEGVPRSRLDVSATAEGPLTMPRVDAKVSGTLTPDPGRSENPITVMLDAHLDARRLLTQAELTLDESRLTLAAEVPAEASLVALLHSDAPITANVDIEVPLLSRLLDLVGARPPRAYATLDGKLGLKLSVAGSGRAPIVQLDLSLDELRYAHTEKSQLRWRAHLATDVLDTRLTMRLGGDQRGTLQAHASLPLQLARVFDPRLEIFDRLGGTTPIAAGLVIDGLDLAHLDAFAIAVPTLLDGGQLDAKVDVAGTIGDPSVAVQLAATHLRSGSFDDIAIAIAARSQDAWTRMSGTVEVGSSTLAKLDAKVHVDAAMLMAGADVGAARLDGSLVFPGFELASFASWVPGLAGKLGGEAHAAGALAAPTIGARLGIDALAVGATRFGRFDLSGKYAAGVVEAKLDAKETSGGSLALEGTVAFGEDPRVVARLVAKAFQLDFQSMGGALPVRRLRGQLDADLQATGPPSALTTHGTFVFSRGTLAIPADARELTELDLRLSLSAGGLRLENLSGKLGAGRFSASGRAELDGVVPRTLDLVAYTKQLPVVQNPIAAALDAKITVHGERKNNQLSGTVTVEDASARLPKLTNARNLQSTGDLEDYVYVDRAARAAATRKAQADLHPLVVDIETVIPGPFHVRSQEIQLDLSGRLVIRTRGSEVSLRGEIESLGGRMELLGKRYDIEHIRIGFDGSPVINPSLDIKAARQLSDARIFIEVNGSAWRPRLRLTSDNPAYDDTKIIAAILSGDPGAKVTDTSLDRKVTGAISGLVVGAIKDQIAPQLPIDVIKVDSAGTDYSGLNSTRLEIGKFLSDNIYLSYAHQFGATQIGTRKINANEGEFEYRFLRHFALDVVFGDAPSGRSDLFWTLHF